MEMAFNRELSCDSDATYCSLDTIVPSQEHKTNVEYIQFLNEVQEKILHHKSHKMLLGKVQIEKYIMRINRMGLNYIRKSDLAKQVKADLITIFKDIKNFEENFSIKNLLYLSQSYSSENTGLSENSFRSLNGPNIPGDVNKICESFDGIPLEMLSGQNFLNSSNSAQQLILTNYDFNIEPQEISNNTMGDMGNMSLNSDFLFSGQSGNTSLNISYNTLTNSFNNAPSAASIGIDKNSNTLPTFGSVCDDNVSMIFYGNANSAQKKSVSKNKFEDGRDNLYSSSSLFSSHTSQNQENTQNNFVFKKPERRYSANSKDFSQNKCDVIENTQDTIIYPLQDKQGTEKKVQIISNVSVTQNDCKQKEYTQMNPTKNSTIFSQNAHTKFSKYPSSLPNKNKRPQSCPQSTNAKKPKHISKNIEIRGCDTNSSATLDDSWNSSNEQQSNSQINTNNDNPNVQDTASANILFINGKSVSDEKNISDTLSLNSYYNTPDFKAVYHHADNISNTEAKLEKFPIQFYESHEYKDGKNALKSSQDTIPDMKTLVETKDDAKKGFGNKQVKKKREVNAKNVLKLKINIFEEPVEALLDADYKRSALNIYDSGKEIEETLHSAANDAKYVNKIVMESFKKYITKKTDEEDTMKQNCIKEVCEDSDNSDESEDEYEELRKITKKELDAFCLEFDIQLKLMKANKESDDDYCDNVIFNQWKD